MITTDTMELDRDSLRPSPAAFLAALCLVLAFGGAAAFALATGGADPAAEAAAPAGGVIGDPASSPNPGVPWADDAPDKGGKIDTDKTTVYPTTTAPPNTYHTTTTAGQHTTTTHGVTTTHKDTTTTHKDTTTTHKDTTTTHKEETTTTAKETTTTEKPGKKLDTPVFKKMNTSYDEKDLGTVIFWWYHPKKTNSHPVPEGVDGVWVHLPGGGKEEFAADDMSYKADRLPAGQHRFGVQYFTETDGYADSDILWIDVEITFDLESCGVDNSSCRK